MNRPPSGAPMPQIRAFPLGKSGFALLGIGLSVDPDPATGDLTINVVAVGGRESTIMGIQPVQVPLLELARLRPDDIVTALEAKERKAAGDALADMPKASG